MAADLLLRAVVDICDDAIFTTGPDDRITSWTGTCERLFGPSAAEVSGHPIGVLFPEHLRPELSGVMARVAAGEKVRHFETELSRPDGMPIPISMSICPLSAAGTTLAGSAIVAHDITEQRLAQATLAEIEQRLQESEALAHTGSWLWDVRTGAVQWSPELHRIHGVDPHDFDGDLAAHLALVHPDDRDRVRARMEWAVSAGRAFDDDHRIVRPDGEVRFLRVRAQPTLGSARTVIGMRALSRDVTVP